MERKLYKNVSKIAPATGIYEHFRSLRAPSPYFQLNYFVQRNTCRFKTDKYMNTCVQLSASHIRSIQSFRFRFELHHVREQIKQTFIESHKAVILKKLF